MVMGCQENVFYGAIELSTALFFCCRIFYRTFLSYYECVHILMIFTPFVCNLSCFSAGFASKHIGHQLSVEKKNYSCYHKICRKNIDFAWECREMLNELRMAYGWIFFRIAGFSVTRVI